MPTQSGPFIGTEAIAAGALSRRALSNENTLVYRNVYLSKDEQLTPTTRAVAAWLWSGRRATVAGRSAAALLGCQWIDVDEPAELTRTQASASDIVIHREKLYDEEVCLVHGIPTTTPARTAFDLGRRGSLPAAVCHLDALANATKLTVAQLNPLLAAHRGMRGVVQLRQALDLMDSGAESPQETRTRLLLIGAGMRRPVTQIDVPDDFGYVFARIDMGWPELLVGVEYDGEQHWTDPAQRERDINRSAELAALGWLIIRVSASLLRYRPWVIVQRVMQALEAKGCPWLGECGVVSRIS